MAAPPDLFVVGRFPPPIDGQTLATARCVEALEAAFRVSRLDTEPPSGDPLASSPRFDLGRTVHYLALRRRLAQALAVAPRAPVLWHAVSPAPLGHLRDVLATVPAFGPVRPVAAVLHRALFEALLAHPVLRGSARRLVARLNAVVVQSPRLGERLAPWVPAERVRVIPNPVSPETVPTPEEVRAKQARRGEGGPLRLLFLSNMMPEKGYVDVLEAAARLHAQGLAFSLDLAGHWPAGPARAQAEAFVASHSLGAVVRIPGGVAGQADVRRLHLAADVFLLPSYHPTETQPIAILEALSAGTPVVTLRRDVMEDMITDGVEGRLVPARAPEAIAEAVVHLAIPDVWRSASAAARRRFERDFSPAVVAEAWRALAADLARLGPAGRQR